MRKLFVLAFLALVLASVHGKEGTPDPVRVVNLRGEQVPVFARPNTIPPKKSVRPIYPRAEREAGIGGEALLLVLVGEEGKVLEVEILSSKPNPSFGAAARASILKWQYKPLVHDGKVTKFINQQTITFDSSDG